MLSAVRSIVLNENELISHAVESKCHPLSHMQNPVLYLFWSQKC